MQPLPLSRTRFGEDIVAEFMEPEHSSSRVIIALSGHPGYSGGKEAMMEYFARRGYWIIVPRVRGTWESGGEFLAHPPDEDVRIVMDGLSAFSDLWSGAEHCISGAQIFLIGGSFGGPAAILASRDPRVKKAATLSAVVDWRLQDRTAEPLELMSEYVPKAFGMAYRGDPAVWQKLAQGGFYNPAEETATIDGTKLLMIHGKGDRVVHADPGEAFAKTVGARFVRLDTDRHMGAGSAVLPGIGRRIEAHFTS